jgi:hypothetical protein
VIRFSFTDQFKLRLPRFSFDDSGVGLLNPVNPSAGYIFAALLSCDGVRPILGNSLAAVLSCKS